MTGELGIRDEEQREGDQQPRMDGVVGHQRRHLPRHRPVEDGGQGQRAPGQYHEGGGGPQGIARSIETPDTEAQQQPVEGAALYEREGGHRRSRARGS